MTRNAQNGSALFMILMAVALFAALSFVVSQQNDSGQALSSEKVKLLASDVIDMGSKMSDTVAHMRLNKIDLKKISFENQVMTGYTNPACTVDDCKVFAYAGGGRDWEKPTPDVSRGADWGYTGDIAIQNIGTSDADLVAILPNLSITLCNQLNKMVGINSTPPLFTGVAAAQFIGTFNATPIMLSNTVIDGKESGCIELRTPSGTAFSGINATPIYAYYQVLSAR